MARKAVKNITKPKAERAKAIKKVKPEPKKAAAVKRAVAPAPAKKVAAAKRLPAPPVLLLKQSASKKSEPVLKAPELKKAASSKGGKKLDLCLLLDCTGSMSSWIQRSKDTLNEIIDTVKANNPGLFVRVSFVGYRDIKDHPRFSIQEFSDDLQAVKKFIATVNASGG